MSTAQRLHPRNSNLASTQSSVHGPPMHDFKRELRAIQNRLAKQDVTIQDWASAADVSHTTLWRILERGQTPSVSTFAALVAAEKKFCVGAK
jgi:predicted transcriptional regulator